VKVIHRVREPNELGMFITCVSSPQYWRCTHACCFAALLCDVCAPKGVSAQASGAPSSAGYELACARVLSEERPQQVHRCVRLWHPYVGAVRYSGVLLWNDDSLVMQITGLLHRLFRLYPSNMLALCALSMLLYQQRQHLL